MADAPGPPAGESVDDLLHEGEHRVDDVTVGDARLVVTSRRLLVRREQGSPRRRAIDRANIGDVRVRTRSTRGYAWSGGQWVFLGGFLLAAWRVVPFGGLVRPVDPPGGTGFDGLFAAVNALVRLLALLDEAFLLGGVAALGWAVLRLAQYVRSRERALEVTVAGEDPLRLPAPASEDPVVRLRELLAQDDDG